MSGAVLYRRVNSQWQQLELHKDFSSPATVSHGRLITASNTGHDAYFDTSLGRTVVDSDLTIHTGLVLASDFVADNGVIRKHDFQGGIIIDRTNVRFVACRVNGGFSGYYLGVHRPFHLEYCTTYTSSNAGDNGIQYQDYTANRCRIEGSSDGAKINGNVTITESYIRCKSQDSLDHNDGLQNAGGAGQVTVERCNIDCRPTNGSGGPNAALFAADGCVGLMTWNDNLLAGGGYVIRCYENATYDVQGNEIIENTWDAAPVARAVIPSSNLTWGTIRPNYVVDSNGVQLSVVDKP